MTKPYRRSYHEELLSLEREIQEMAAAAGDLFDTSIRALSSMEPDAAESVIRSDDKIDEFYLSIEKRILDLFALQSPVASDLRLLTVLLHINLHLERIADMAVNIAKIARLVERLPRNALVMQHLEEMGGIALSMLTSAMDALARRDVELCRALPEMDDPLDRLNRGMLHQILTMAVDQSLLEWGVRMHVVSRQIERVGDHAVDIGEQVAFLVTGEFVEFTDASHPEAGPP